ncbi:MAG: hypothetical protein Q9168_007999 [Polycauliona sp. 1 TL-2023]
MPDGTADTGTRGDGSVSARAPSAAALDQLKVALLSMTDKNDETKLVGMGRLNAIVNSDTDLAIMFRGEKESIVNAWDMVPGRFLDRLLAVVEYNGEQVVERDWVANQAVSLIHTFVKLVPEATRNNKKFSKRIDKLLVIVGLDMYVLSETKKLALEILDELAGTRNGSMALLWSKNWPMLLQSAVVHPIIHSIGEKAYRHAFTYKTAEDRLGLQPELHDRIYDWVSGMHLVSDPTPLFEHVYNLVRWHVPAKEISDAPDWLVPLTQSLLGITSVECTDAPRTQNAIVNLSAALVRCYPSHSPPLLYGGPPFAELPIDTEPLAWMFLQDQLIDIRTSIPTLMNSADGDHKSTLMRLAGCYGLIAAFTKFLVKSVGGAAELDNAFANKAEVSQGIRSQPESKSGGFHELPYDPSLLLRIREEISNVCSLTMEYLLDRFEAWDADKTIRRAPRGVGSASDRFEFVHKNTVPSMTEDPMVMEQLKMLAFWLREDDGEVLRKEAAGIMVQVSLGLYGTTEELRTPLLIILAQCSLVPHALDRIRRSSGWKALFSDLSSITGSRDVDEHVIQDGLCILDLIGPPASDAISSGKDMGAWKDFARIAVQLDEEGPADLLSLKGSVAIWSIALLRMVDASTLDAASKRLQKMLSAVPARLLKAKDRMSEEAVQEWRHYGF